MDPEREIVFEHTAPLLQAEYVPGLVVGISRGGTRSFHAFGSLATDTDARPDEYTLYETGSVGKLFTALLLAVADRAGELDMERPLAEIPGLALDSGVPAARIRPWQLAAHVSGLPREPDDLDFGAENPYASYTREKLWAFLERFLPERAPGADYEYSNLGAGLLGLVLEHVSERSYADLVRERIAVPLGLADTVVNPDGEQLRRLACPTTFGLPGITWPADDALAAAGCLRSTAHDTLAFLERCLDPPPGPLREPLLEIARVRHRFDEESGVGLGWHVLEDGALWHNGSTGGYHAFAAIDREQDLALCVLANDVEPQVTEAAVRLFDALRGRSAAPLELHEPAAVSEAGLGRLVGRYVDCDSGVGIDVRREGNFLLARIDGQVELRVIPESETRFLYRAVEAALRFELEGDGAAHAVVVEQDGGEWVFTSVRGGDSGDLPTDASA